jgi:hypothetical protein
MGQRKFQPKEPVMLRAVALWILGVPIFVIILLYFFNIL